MYGDWTSGPTGDGIYTTDATVYLSKVLSFSYSPNLTFI